jgi:hypothetical protein
MVALSVPSSRSYRNSFPLLYLENWLLIYRRDYLDLYYAGRPVAKLPCYVFSHVIDDVRTPFLAYTDNFEIASFREDSIPIPKCNLPAWRLRKATLARLQPTNIEQDPYLVGVLIALAQARQYARSDDATARQSSHTVRIYLTVSSQQPSANQKAGPSPRYESR